jgi:hypothetical protein
MTERTKTVTITFIKSDDARLQCRNQGRWRAAKFHPLADKAMASMVAYESEEVVGLFGRVSIL